jgi:hypothetical protein
MSAASVDLVAMLVTLSLPAYAAGAALYGLDIIRNWRKERMATLTSVCQYTGAAIALIGLVYRHQTVALIGFLLVALGALLGGTERKSELPWVETGLAALTLVNLVSLTLLYATA